MTASGHMKIDGHLGRCYLKGRIGDAMNVVLVACVHSLRKILAWPRSFSPEFGAAPSVATRWVERGSTPLPLSRNLTSTCRGVSG